MEFFVALEVALTAECCIWKRSPCGMLKKLFMTLVEVDWKPESTAGGFGFCFIWSTMIGGTFITGFTVCCF